MQIHVLALLCFIALLKATRATASIEYYPSFGSPLISGDRLVFSGPAAFPGISPRRLICIEPQSGKKLWDIAIGTNTIRPYLLAGDKLLVTVGPDIHQCDVKAGTLKLLYTTGYENARLFKQTPGIILVYGERADVDYVSFVVSSKWTKIWETPHLSYALAEGHDVLICKSGIRQPA